MNLCVTDYYWKRAYCTSKKRFIYWNIRETDYRKRSKLKHSSWVHQMKSIIHNSETKISFENNLAFVQNHFMYRAGTNSQILQKIIKEESLLLCPLCRVFSERVELGSFCERKNTLNYRVSRAFKTLKAGALQFSQLMQQTSYNLQAENELTLNNRSQDC